MTYLGLWVVTSIISTYVIKELQYSYVFEKMPRDSKEAASCTRVTGRQESTGGPEHEPLLPSSSKAGNAEQVSKSLYGSIS